MGLRQNILEEPISSLRISPGVMVKPWTTVGETIRQMRERYEGCAVVIDEHGRPEGKFTEHQIAELLVSDPGFLSKPVSGFLRQFWARMRAGDSIAMLIHKLQDYRLRYVIVVDDEGKAIGVIGQKPLMEYIAEYFPRQVKVQNMEANVAMQAREGA